MTIDWNKPLRTINDHLKVKEVISMKVPLEISNGIINKKVIFESGHCHIYNENGKTFYDHDHVLDLENYDPSTGLSFEDSETIQINASGDTSINVPNLSAGSTVIIKNNSNESIKVHSLNAPTVITTKDRDAIVGHHGTYCCNSYVTTNKLPDGTFETVCMKCGEKYDPISLLQPHLQMIERGFSIQTVVLNEKEKSMQETKLIPFDLEAAKRGEPVITRDGQPVRILCFDANLFYHNHTLQNIAGIVNNALESWNERGAYNFEEESSDYDLFMAPNPKKKINRYRNSNRI